MRKKDSSYSSSQSILSKKGIDVVDPNAAQEAQKYTNPIPSREYILSYLSAIKRLATRVELERALDLSDADSKEALRRRLKAMQRDGQLILTRRKGYGIAKKMDLIRGHVSGHKEGFGFVVPEDGSADLFLSPYQMNRVFPEDCVLVRVTGIDRRGRREANIVEVLERNTRHLVGRYVQEEGLDRVVPSNTRIHLPVLIPPGEAGEAVVGQIVMVEVLQQPEFRKPATGRIVKILGEHLTPGMGTTLAIHSYHLPHEWSESVQKELNQMKKKQRMQAAVTDLEPDRVDLRDLPFVTIDGSDSKDFDDAVYAAPERKSWRLWVAIADVSHYVKPGTAVDQEAQLRGTSVYFPDRVLPMLPEILSNDWCSLNPNVDRLTLTCEMLISKKGQLKEFKFYPAIIGSRARLTYEAVTRYLAVGKAPKQYHAIFPCLEALHSLYEVLHQARMRRGAIDFTIQEPRVIFKEDGRVKQIIPTERTVAHRMIEECMLMANVAAARFLLKHKQPGLFRIHVPPSADKFTVLKTFLLSLGLRLSLWRTPKPSDYARLLQNSVHHPESRLIQVAILRAMSQALYSPKNQGHFGLALSEYTHFTSPIRRYPDLLVHRAIRRILHSDATTLNALGEHCSMTERRADEATREVISGLKCEFMQAHLGKIFQGTISHVTGFGLFVELEKSLVEGLIHISNLRNDYYHFDPIKLELRGERTGSNYRIGQPVTVRVARVDLEAREIDFELQ